jgi:glycosyltransferase involved in cell wall biosynthesis
MVSVIITCYNYGKYLAGCIESALSQTYRNIEVIIVNDGSTDNSDEIMVKYLSDPRIRYIKRKNAGQANAKNTGIRNAKGAFLAFLDADDLWDSTKLEKQIPLFSYPTVGVVYSIARYIDENGSSVEFTVDGKYLTPQSGKVTENLFFDNFIPFSSSVVRRECVDKVGLFDETLKMGIDWDLWLRISAGYTFAYVDEPLLFYRIGHSGQMSKNLEERQRCSDRIMSKFVLENQGTLPKAVIQKAMAYTNCNRGYYFRHIDLHRSNRFYLSAIKCNIAEWSAYRGLLKNMYILLSDKLK